MTGMKFFKHVLLMFGLGASGVACGECDCRFVYDPLYVDIQSDMKSLTCTQAGCHNATATNKLKIDTTAGEEMDNYKSLFDQQLVIKSDAASSPLIRVPSTGMATSGALHVTTLTGSKLTKWQTWINSGAWF